MIPAEQLLTDLDVAGFPTDLGEATLHMNARHPAWQRLSTGEKAVVAIACSLGRTRVHVNLRDEIERLDADWRRRVVDAIAATANIPEATR